jgi:ABC-2 type transport system ATP-binding protein
VTAAALAIEGLTKKYGSFFAVQDLSFEVSGGEIFALLGPNGAGKTTTLKMLMGVLKPSAGSARICGHDCFAERPEVMRHVGYLPDEPVFHDFLRGREILQFVGEMHGLSAKEIRQRAGVWTERLTLDDALEEYAVNYSKGMKKKLALTCALLHDPEVLLLDEPTNGLDPYATRTMHEVLRERSAAGQTVLFSTHLLDQAERLCHRVAIVYQGRMAALGTLEDLRAQRTSGGSSLEEIFFSVTGGVSAEPAAEA